MEYAATVGMQNMFGLLERQVLHPNKDLKIFTYLYCNIDYTRYPYSELF